MTAPLHISQPENDSRTPLPPVQAYVDAMRDLGKPVDFHLMPAGHAGSGMENEVEMFERWLAFARKHTD